jgi:hypothetical protein
MECDVLQLVPPTEHHVCSVASVANVNKKFWEQQERKIKGKNAKTK